MLTLVEVVGITVSEYVEPILWQRDNPSNYCGIRSAVGYVKIDRDNKKFFGGGGAPESSEARRKDPAIDPFYALDASEEIL